MGEMNRDNERLLRNTKKHFMAVYDLLERRISESKRDSARFEKAKHRVDVTTEDGKLEESTLNKMISAIAEYIKEDEETASEYVKRISDIDKQMQTRGG